jgi:hypothetical protein
MRSDFELVPFAKIVAIAVGTERKEEEETTPSHQTG